MTIDTLEDIQILHAADLSNTDFACFFKKDFNTIKMSVEFDNTTNILSLKPS